VVSINVCATKLLAVDCFFLQA